MNSDSRVTDKRAVETALRQYAIRTTRELDTRREGLRILMGRREVRAAITDDPLDARSCTCNAPSDSPLRQIHGGPLDVLHTLLRAACTHRDEFTSARDRERHSLIRGQARALYYGSLVGLGGYDRGRGVPWPALSMETPAYSSRIELEVRYGDVAAAILDKSYTAERAQLAKALSYARAGMELLRTVASVASDLETQVGSRDGRRRRQVVRKLARDAREGGTAAVLALTDGFPATMACVTALEEVTHKSLATLGAKHTRRHLLETTARRTAAHFGAMLAVFEDVHAGALHGAPHLANRRRTMAVNAAAEADTGENGGDDDGPG